MVEYHAQLNIQESKNDSFEGASRGSPGLPLTSGACGFFRSSGVDSARVVQVAQVESLREALSSL